MVYVSVFILVSMKFVPNTREDAHIYIMKNKIINWNESTQFGYQIHCVVHVVAKNLGKF